MGSLPRVTVLMPMRNPGAFIEAAVGSILSQRGADLELVVIDDGSTDGSRQWLEAQGDARVRIADGPRSGISACMNLGLSLARGEVVMRCDSDDVYPPGRVASHLAFLDDHPAFVAVCGPFSMTGPDGEHISSPRIAPTSPREDVAADVLDSKLRTHLCAYSFRRAVVATIGDFRRFFQTAEDIDFQLRLAAAGPVGFLADNAYVYRLHDASITHSQTSVLRKFFETTAYAMSRERLATGTDALMRGEPIALPDVNVDRDRAETAGHHISQLLVGEAWVRFAAGDRAGARSTAWRAARANPGHLDAWRSLLLLHIKRG